MYFLLYAVLKFIFLWNVQKIVHMIFRFAQVAGVPIIVAINKCDRYNIDIVSSVFPIMLESRVPIKYIYFYEEMKVYHKNFTYFYNEMKVWKHDSDSRQAKSIIWIRKKSFSLVINMIQFRKLKW